MNIEKLKKLQAQVRIGGKGTPRRKKKVVHSTHAADEKILQSSLKKLSVNPIPLIEEVNLFKEDGTVIHFNNPKTQASIPANTFAIIGHGEIKHITEMLPGIVNQLGPDELQILKSLAGPMGHRHDHAGPCRNLEPMDDADLLDTIKNFDEASKEKDTKKKTK